jgi:hypothetical protein
MNHQEPAYERDITVCYSGGLDSTYVAQLMGREYGGQVHLFTMLPYGNLFWKWADRHVVDLKRLLGEDKVHHHYEDTRRLFDEITVNTLLADLKTYKSHFIWCLGCQYAMVARVIVYNLEHQVPYIFFSSSVGGEYAVMSMPVTHACWAEFYAEYGIEFRAPLLERNILKAQERQELREQGVWPGHRFNRAVLGVQPLCVFGLQHLADILFNVHTSYDPAQVQRFLEDKKPILRKHIDAHFRRKRQDVGELVEQLRGLHRRYGTLQEAPPPTP